MKRLFRWMVRLAVLLLLLVAGALTYLHVAGFPGFLRDFISRQMNRAGIACQFQSLQLELLRGVVMQRAVLADVREPDRPLARIDQLALTWNWGRLLRRQNALTGLRIANATIALPTPPDERGAAEFTASGAYADFRFQDDGTIIVDQLTGLYCGIRLQMSGRVRPQSARPPGEAKPAKPAVQFNFITKILRELNGLAATAPPQLYVKFDVDLAQPLDSQVMVRLQGTDLSYRQLHVDAAAVDVSLRNGAIQIDQVEVKIDAGAVRLTGRYDVAGGGFDLNFSSTIDPLRLLPLFPPGVATNVAHEVRLRANPEITMHYTLSPETGSLPRLQGTLKTGGVDVRGVPFRSITCDFANQGPQLWITNAVIVMAEGRLTGSGQFHIESSDFDYQFDSTLDPRKLLPLMIPVGKRIVEPSWFEQPPHIVAHVTGDFVDPDNFAYDAELTTRRCSYRGVAVQCAAAKLRLRQSRLSVRDLVLTRPEGELRGHLVADFDNELVGFDLTTTANPSEMAGLLGPKAVEMMQPYRFGPRTEASLQGVIDFLDDDGTAWTARVANDGFSYWKFTAEHTQANLTFTNQTLRVADCDADFYSGKLRGTADFTFAQGSASYRFNFDARNIDIHKLLLAARGHREGRPVTGLLTGHCELQGAGTDLDTLTGKGNLEIGDGVLWEAPMFGIFSHLLGNTKATDAKATFTIANQAVKTEDLQIAAGVFTAESRGQTGFDGKLDYRVKAKFLRNWLGIGWLGQILGEILEYRVTGTIGQPAYRPVNLPKELLPHDTK